MSDHELGRVNKLKNFFEDLAARKQSQEQEAKKSIPKVAKTSVISKRSERKSNESNEEAYNMCGVDIKSVGSLSKSSIDSGDNNINVIYERFSVELDDDNDQKSVAEKPSLSSNKPLKEHIEDDIYTEVDFYLGKLLKLVLTAKCCCVCLVENHSAETRQKTLDIFDQLNLKSFDDFPVSSDDEKAVQLRSYLDDLQVYNNTYFPS